MATNKIYTPNEKAKAFMEALSKDTLKSLKEVNHELGTDIKTGSINTLIVKGLVVSVADGVEYTAKVVETRTYPNGAVITFEKEVVKTETGYKLAQSKVGEQSPSLMPNRDGDKLGCNSLEGSKTVGSRCEVLWDFNPDGK